MHLVSVHTQHPWEDHPLDDGGWRSLHVQVGAGDVLRGQQQEEEESQVGRRVTDEFDERLLDEASQRALRSQQVDLKRETQELKQGRRRRGERREEKLAKEDRG